MTRPQPPKGAPRTPLVATDCVVFGLDFKADRALQVLLVERGVAPHKGGFALPGGLVQVDESVDAAARRELAEETGVTDLFLEQLYTFGDVGRDPRGPVVSVAYYGLVRLTDHRVKAATDAANADWYPADAPPPLAFDHARILATALERLRGKVRYAPIGFELLPERFTLGELQRLYEVVLGRDLDKRNFRKKLIAMDFLTDSGEQQTGVAHRAARLYSFDRGRYERLTRRGFLFEL